MYKLWGMNSAMFGLITAIVGVLLFLIGTEASYYAGISKFAAGIGGAVGLWVYAVAAAFVFIRHAKVVK